MSLLALLKLTWAHPAKEIVGQWSATGMMTATIEISIAETSEPIGTIIACDTKKWLGKKLLTDFTLLPNHKWKARLHSPRYNVSKEVHIQRLSNDKLEVVANFVMFEKRFIWHKNHPKP